MKALRSTMYPPDPAYLHGGRQPMTVVVRECDLREDIDVIDGAALMDQPSAHMFVVSDIFDVPDDADIAQATMKGIERMNERRERETNMAIHYYWTAGLLGRMAEDGVIRNPDPAPLTATEIRVSMRRLAKHPDYRRQTVVTEAEDGWIVTLADGKVSE